MSYESEANLVVHTCERFEVARVTVLSCLAFGGDVPLAVLDDCSNEPRIDKWLTSLMQSGMLLYLRSPERIGIGRMYRWTADLAPDFGGYMIHVDGDMLVCPDAAQNLYAALKHWEPDGIGMLSGFGLRGRRPDVIQTDGWQVYNGHFSDIAFWIISAENLLKYRPNIRTVLYGQPLAGVKLHMLRDGLERKLCLAPRIKVVHLGRFDSTVPNPRGSAVRCYYGCFKTNPCPDLFDSKDFVSHYPASAIDLGTRIRDDYLSRWDGIYDADRGVGIT